MAGPRATVHVLAGLPVIGLLLGTAIGARPIDFLFGSALGVGCVVGAVVLDAWALRGRVGSRGARRALADVAVPQSLEPRGSAGAAVAVGGVVGLLAGFVGGWVLGFAVGSAATFVLLRRDARSGGSRTPGGSVGRQLPAALDLLAACLAAGAAPAPALAAVGEAFDGEVRDMLSAVARLAMLGAPVENRLGKLPERPALGADRTCCDSCASLRCGIDRRPRASCRRSTAGTSHRCTGCGRARRALRSCYRSVRAFCRPSC